MLMVGLAGEMVQDAAEPKAGHASASPTDSATPKGMDVLRGFMIVLTPLQKWRVETPELLSLGVPLPRAHPLSPGNSPAPPAARARDCPGGKHPMTDDYSTASSHPGRSPGTSPVLLSPCRGPSWPTATRKRRVLINTAKMAITSAKLIPSSNICQNPSADVYPGQPGRPGDDLLLSLAVFKAETVPTPTRRAAVA